MLIRIEQNPINFPLFFQRALTWAHFLEKVGVGNLVFLTDRKLHKQALSFFPEDRVHRLPDSLDDQISKTLALAKGDHSIYCHFGETPGPLVSPELMSKFRQTVYFGPPVENQIFCHFLVHGDLDASLLKYACQGRCRLLIGPAFAFPISPHGERPPSSAVTVFFYQQPDTGVLEVINGSLRDLGVTAENWLPGDLSNWPDFKDCKLFCTDAGPHLQELAGRIPHLSVLAGTPRQLQLCYSVEAAGLATNLGWPPGTGREIISQRFAALLESASQSHTAPFSSIPISSSPLNPPFFEKLLRILQESTP